MQRNGSSSGEIVKSNIVTLVTYDTYTTTKSASSGSWYYEYTHISGDHFQLPGFIIGNQNRIHVYPQSHTEFIEIAFFGNINVPGYTTYDKIPLSNYRANHTIGLGFDTNKKIFSVIYEGQRLDFQTSYSLSENTVSPFFIEANSPDITYRNKISVNFGIYSFRYGLPKNYLPWDTSRTFNPSMNSRYLSFSLLPYFLES